MTERDDKHEHEPDEPERVASDQAAEAADGEQPQSFGRWPRRGRPMRPRPLKDVLFPDGERGS